MRVNSNAFLLSEIDSMRLHLDGLRGEVGFGRMASSIHRIERLEAQVETILRIVGGGQFGSTEVRKKGADQWPSQDPSTRE